VDISLLTLQYLSHLVTFSGGEIMRASNVSKSTGRLIDVPASPASASAYTQRYPTAAATPGAGGSPKSDKSFGFGSDMLDAKHSRKRAESDLQLLANRIALLKLEEQKALTKVSETKTRAAEILE
jgi:hypothetical protein